MSFRETWQRFRANDRKGLLIDRVEGPLAITKRGYVFDRRAFRAYALLVGVVIVYIMFSSGVGWRELYISCPWTNERDCENPCYHNFRDERCSEIVLREYLPRGYTLGRTPPPEYEAQVRGLFFVIVGGFLFAFGMNHYLHNRGRSLRLILPEEARR